VFGRRPSTFRPREPASDQRQRRHDEKVQHEILDGMARMLAVLQEMSDAVRALQTAIAGNKPEPAPAVTPTPRLLNIDAVAEMLGITSRRSDFELWKRALTDMLTKDSSLARYVGVVLSA
jgi:hypothetical protein